MPKCATSGRVRCSPGGYRRRRWESRRSRPSNSAADSRVDHDFAQSQRWPAGFLVQSGCMCWREHEIASSNGSYVDAPDAEAKHARGTMLAVFKKLPDGSWKIFRARGRWSQGLPPRPLACDVKPRQ